MTEVERDVADDEFDDDLGNEDEDDDLDDDDDDLEDEYDDEDDDDDGDGDAGNRSAAPIASAVLHHVVASLVDEPDAVEVTASERRGRVRLSVLVSPGDRGRVIGRRGRVAGLIRSVVGAAGTKDGVSVDVEFVD